MASALGRYTVTTAAITTATTTTIATPDTTNTPNAKIYVYWVGIDVSVAGTTSTAKVQANGGAPIVGLYATTAVGHQESYGAFSFKDYAGIELTVGKALEVVTAGGAQATLTVTVVYEVRG